MALSVTSGRVPVKADINVTPMIDVMLVLLIIFMIVTPIITSGFQAQIPRAENAEKKEEDQGEIRLGIDKDGRYYIDQMDPATGQYTGPRLVPTEQLQGTLIAIYAARTRDKIMFLKADEGIEFARVQAVVEIARKAGVRVIMAIAEQKQSLTARH
ncbi:MAG TPA: biopolymer transporter ExbD [Gemmatimonadales bacterium]